MALRVYATLGAVLSIGLILGAALVPRVTNTPVGKEVRNARR